MKERFLPSMVFLIFLTLVSAGAFSCGKKGPPLPPDEEKSFSGENEKPPQALPQDEPKPEVKE